MHPQTHPAGLGRHLARRALVGAFVSALIALPLATATGAAHAQARWPERPIRLVVPYPAGGSADTVARGFALLLADRLGQPIVIDNKPGASGNIGTMDVHRARPDGYTLLFNPSAHVINPEIMDKSPYRALEDFTPISQVAKGPLVLMVTPSLPAHTPAELAALARARPDAITFATSVIGSASHIAEELFNRTAGVNILIVPYKGNAPALTDLMGGQVSAMFDPAVTAVPLVKSGKVRALAVTGRTRLASAPAIPTTAEAGMQGLEFYTWYGLWGPKGLPEAVAARLEQAARQVAADPAFRQSMDDKGLEAVGSARAAFAQLIAQEGALYRSIAQQSSIRAPAN